MKAVTANSIEKPSFDPHDNANLKTREQLSSQFSKYFLKNCNHIFFEGRAIAEGKNFVLPGSLSSRYLGPDSLAKIRFGKLQN